MPSVEPKGSQVAAIPFRRTGTGVEVLLVTSRETHRWVVPKGWPWADRGPHEAAAAEAWEEAGVRGKVQKKPVGCFHYGKRRKGDVLAVEVTVFLLDVKEEAAHWPEEGQRQRAWFDPASAAEAVAEEELKDLLRSLAA